ncbi:MAG: DUF4185 domain-containing protein [Acidimicrobiales bacterium]|nr:DUF4185 domain-containing protein [Acidimicrobiales bacterium]
MAVEPVDAPSMVGGQIKLVRRALAGVAVASVAMAGLSGCDRVETVGEVRNPTVAIGRDGAASAVLGGKVFWAFGDTFTANGGVRNSGAYASIADPTKVTDTLTRGVPAQLVPFDAAESAQNGAGDGQWVIWPASVIATSDARALVLSTKFHASDAGWVNGSLVVSEVSAGSTTSTRLGEPLRAPQATYANSPYADGGNIYLHDCGGIAAPPELLDRLQPGSVLSTVVNLTDPSTRCRVARVPAGEVLDPAAYRYWNGLGWGTDPSQAVPAVPGSNSGISVAWVPAWKRYAALSNPGFSKDIYLSTSPRPEGPWTTPRKVFTAPANIYAVRIHPHLSSPDLSTMAITYFRTDTASTPGGVVLAKLTPTAP